jgi:hypothetical protein
MWHLVVVSTPTCAEVRPEIWVPKVNCVGRTTSVVVSQPSVLPPSRSVPYRQNGTCVVAAGQPEVLKPATCVVVTSNFSARHPLRRQPTDPWSAP